jgi:hypothetical protein
MGVDNPRRRNETETEAAAFRRRLARTRPGAAAPSLARSVHYLYSTLFYSFFKSATGGENALLLFNFFDKSRWVKWVRRNGAGGKLFVEKTPTSLDKRRKFF